MNGMGEVIHDDVLVRETTDYAWADEVAGKVADAIAAHLAEVVGGLREDVARTMAEMEPGEEWPSNETLGGSLTGTRDDEYRDAHLDQADAVLAVVVEALTGHPARSGGAVGDDSAEVALGEGDEILGPQIGSDGAEREARL